MLETPILENDFVIVGVALTIYGHLVWAAWEFLVYAEGKYPITDIHPRHRDHVFTFFSIFWPIILVIIIIIFLILLIKKLWKTLLLGVKKLLKLKRN